MTTNPQTPTPATGLLSFDGIGINGPDEYRTRLATFTSHDTAQQWGPLLAAAPAMRACLAHMLAAIRMGNEPRHWDTDKTVAMLEAALAPEATA